MVQKMEPVSRFQIPVYFPLIHFEIKEIQTIDKIVGLTKFCSLG